LEENRAMKPKQLANVLIRILGLSMVAHSFVPILNVVAGLSSTPIWFSNRPSLWYYLVTTLIPTAIGIFLMLKSRLIVEKLFKDEAE
jgi:hypothetical protein